MKRILPKEAVKKMAEELANELVSRLPELDREKRTVLRSERNGYTFEVENFDKVYITCDGKHDAIYCKNKIVSVNCTPKDWTYENLYPILVDGITKLNVQKVVYDDVEDLVLVVLKYTKEGIKERLREMIAKGMRPSYHELQGEREIIYNNIGVLDNLYSLWKRNLGKSKKEIESILMEEDPNNTVESYALAADRHYLGSIFYEVYQESDTQIDTTEPLITSTSINDLAQKIFNCEFFFDDFDEILEDVIENDEQEELIDELTKRFELRLSEGKWKWANGTTYINVVRDIYSDQVNILVFSNSGFYTAVGSIKEDEWTYDKIKQELTSALDQLLALLTAGHSEDILVDKIADTIHKDSQNWENKIEIVDYDYLWSNFIEDHLATIQAKANVGILKIDTDNSILTW